MYLSDYSRHANSADRARRRIFRHGVTPRGAKVWTAEEDTLCRKHGDNYKLLMELLPHRTYLALRARCQSLGLRPKRQYCSGAELLRVRRLYPRATHEELLAAFPHRKLDHLRKLARYHGIYRAKSKLISTGFPIIDAVRNRCAELNYSMGDLDAIAQSKCYFRKGNWRNSQTPNYGHVCRAIEALGGKLTVDWGEE